MFSKTSKDFDALKAEMFARVPVLAPALTNLNEGEFTVALINLVAGVGDMLSYSLDRMAEEVYLPTARLKESVTNLARLIDYRPSRAVAAKTTLRFTLPAALAQNLTIPKYTQVKTADGTIFTTHDAVILYAGRTSVDVEGYQGTFVTDLFTGTGQDVQQFILTKGNVAQNFLDIVVGAQVWTEDTAQVSPKETSVFEVLADATGKTAIQFTRFLGDVPTQNGTVQVAYVSTKGAGGNIGAGIVTDMVTAIPGGDALTVTNVTVASGGKDEESLDEVRVNAPRQLRTLNRAVTLSDYKDLLEMFPKVAKAQAINHNGYVECYVAPENGEQFFLLPPAVTVTTRPNASGSLTSKQHWVAVTAVDQYGGETNAIAVNPVTGQQSNIVATVTIGSGFDIGVIIQNVPGAVAYRVYDGDSGEANLRVQEGPAQPGATTTLWYGVDGSGVVQPSVNTTGVRAQSGAQTLKNAAEAMLEDKRTIGTIFALFNPTYVPVAVAATVKIYDNYAQTAVKGAVQSALADFFSFDRQQFGEDVTLAALYTAVMDVEGVRSVTFAAPSADLPIADGAIATLGTVALTMTGGVV